MHHLAHRPWGHRWGGTEQWWLANLIWLALVAGLVALAVILALRLAGRSPGGHPSAPSRPAFDPAINEVRMRYARGEVSREEYLRAAGDLGAPVPPPEPPSSPPPA